MVLDGERIKRERRRLGWSQADLSVATTLAVRTIGEAERGGRIAPDTACDIAVTLGITLLELLGADGHAIRDKLLDGGYAPLSPPEPWIPRSEESEIVQALREAPEGAILCIEGPSGIGKSGLARRAAADLHEAFPEGVVWLNAATLEGEGRLLRVQRDLAGIFGFHDGLPDADIVAREAWDRAFARHLWTSQRLVVADDVLEPDLVQRLLTSNRPAWVLVTTAHRHVAMQLDATRIELTPWEDEGVVALIGSVAGPERLAADAPGTKRLTRLAAGFPLYARAAAERLKRHPYKTPGDYVSEVGEAVPGPLEDAMPADQLAALRALYVFQDQPFSAAFAAAATGLSPTAMRSVLNDLTDVYLVRETSVEDEPTALRFQLEAGVRDILNWRSTDAARAADRLLDAAPELAAQTAAEGGMQAASRLQRDLPAWRLLLDVTAHRTLGPDPIRPATTPDDVPDVLPEADPDDLRGFARTMSALAVLLLYRQTPHTGSWATAGLAAARAVGDDEACGILSLTLMMWWASWVHDYPTAGVWAEETRRLAPGVRSTERAVSMLGFAAWALRMARGRDACMPLLEEAVEVSRRADASPLLQAAALGSLGAMMLLDPDPARAWPAGRDLLEQAIALDIPDSPVGRHVLHRVNGNLAAMRLILGEPIPDAGEVRAAVDDFRAQYVGYDLLQAQYVHLGRMLGAEVEWEMPPIKDILLGVGPAEVSHTVHKLEESVIDLGVEVPGVQYGGAIDTPAGQMAVPTLAVGGSGTGWWTMCVILPVQPIREALSGEGLAFALRFTEVAVGSDSPLHVALTRLGAQAGPATR